ncbi:hypothetical protein ACVWWI_004034 [Bradyrhizobium sp. USDA 3686]|nr:hypothetical protein [Bradyrhizobium canariense]
MRGPLVVERVEGADDAQDTIRQLRCHSRDRLPDLPVNSKDGIGPLDDCCLGLVALDGIQNRQNSPGLLTPFGPSRSPPRCARRLLAWSLSILRASDCLQSLASPPASENHARRATARHFGHRPLRRGELLRHWSSRGEDIHSSTVHGAKNWNCIDFARASDCGQELLRPLTTSTLLRAARRAEEDRDTSQQG